MKAAVRHEYGPPEVLHVEEVETPSPADDEVLVRVQAASVNLGDWELLTGNPRYISVLAHLFGPKPQYTVPSPGHRGASARRGGPFAIKYKILGTDMAGRVRSPCSSPSRMGPR